MSKIMKILHNRPTKIIHTRTEMNNTTPNNNNNSPKLKN